MNFERQYNIYFLSQFIEYKYGITLKELNNEFAPLINIDTKIIQKIKINEINQNNISYGDKFRLFIKCNSDYTKYFIIITYIIYYNYFNYYNIWGGGLYFIHITRDYDVDSHQGAISDITKFFENNFNKQPFKINKMDLEEYILYFIKIMCEFYKFVDNFIKSEKGVYIYDYISYDKKIYNYNYYFYVYLINFIYKICFNIIYRNIFKNRLKHDSILKILYVFNDYYLLHHNLYYIKRYELVPAVRICKEYIKSFTDINNDLILKFQSEYDINDYDLQELNIICYYAQIMKFYNRFIWITAVIRSTLNIYK